MEPMLAWALINREFAKRPRYTSPRGEEGYYRTFCRWTAPLGKVTGRL
mgnify:CR=1 FL=1